MIKKRTSKTAIRELTDLELQSIVGGVNGSVKIDPSTGAYIYKPNNDSAHTGGSDSFTVTVNDQHGSFTP